MRKLNVGKESLRKLNNTDFKNAAGGYLGDPGSGTTNTCTSWGCSTITAWPNGCC